jgi:hypothetical protein
VKRSLAAIVVVLTVTLVAAQIPTPSPTPLTRHYRDGEILTYRMTATNEEWHYTAETSSMTKKTTGGSYVEEFRWINMTSNGQAITLQPATARFGNSFHLILAGCLPGPI